jgi:tetratricopeptide (TPR) repeat protein
VDALVGRGLARAKTDNFFKAMDDFDRALQINPKLANALAYRGLCHEQFGDYDKAIADLTEAARLAPDEAIVYVWRGNVYRAQDETGKALADFNEAIRRDSSLAFAYASRGDLYRILGELDKAVADLTEAIRLDNASDLSYVTTRAAVYAELGKHAEAAADYSTVLEREPNNTEARWQRSELYRRLRKFDRALADCQQLDLLLMVQVAVEQAPLRAGNKTIGTVSQGAELQVLQANGKWLWVEALLPTGEAVRGWIDRQHVRAPQPFDDDLPAPPAPPAPPV